MKNITLGRANNFDFLRFVAASLVIFSHSFPLAYGNFSRETLAVLTHGQENLGSVAIKIFFIISGFLITQSYDRSKNLLIFFKARILRLYPALFVVIVITVFILGPIITKYSLAEYFTKFDTYKYLISVSIVKVFYALPGVFKHNVYGGGVNGSIWTLRFELGCYVIVSLLGIAKILRKDIVLTIFVLSYIMHFIITKNHQGIYYAIYFLTYFMSGAVLYMFRDKIRISSIIAVCCVIILCVSSIFGVLDAASPMVGSYLVIYLAFNPNIKLNNFAHRGDFSYGLYICAFPIQQLIVQIYGGTMNSYLNFLIAFPITLMCSIISWHLIEKRCLKLKNIPIKFPKLFTNRINSRNLTDNESP